MLHSPKPLCNSNTTCLFAFYSLLTISWVRTNIIHHPSSSVVVVVVISVDLHCFPGSLDICMCFDSVLQCHLLSFVLGHWIFSLVEKCDAYIIIYCCYYYHTTIMITIIIHYKHSLKHDYCYNLWPCQCLGYGFFLCPWRTAVSMYLSIYFFSVCIHARRMECLYIQPKLLSQIAFIVSSIHLR